MTPPLDIIHTPPRLAPCEHIAGNEKFALKALAIQGNHLRADGSSLVDITLDLEDGAPVGQEAALRATFITLINSEHRYLRKESHHLIHYGQIPLETLSSWKV